jgi:hypothetical protein
MRHRRSSSAHVGAGAERAQLFDSLFGSRLQESRFIDAASSQDEIAGLISPCASLPIRSRASALAPSPYWTRAESGGCCHRTLRRFANRFWGMCLFNGEFATTDWLISQTPGAFPPPQPFRPHNMSRDPARVTLASWEDDLGFNLALPTSP